ncbi:hypothetical protein LTR62_005179 [Meristemomyces frigidus]|uniref:Exonuclease domain-containing protein n=1 Tax=Meristemomyces frigidus TaxID=1508187 RepID=A0AAN7YNR7_9PEZI|nr:hypothetical protein LTR62_005179 [Meristemomyces frigidus]
MDLVTPIIAIDAEFQIVHDRSENTNRQRIGRFSAVNYDGEVIYDVFAYRAEDPNEFTFLPPPDKKLGVYKADLEPANGARPFAEVEANIKAIIEAAEKVVGHSIQNDIKACSPGLWDNILLPRDTQLYEPYRVYGRGEQRLPKLSVLAEQVLGLSIQGVEHSSVEDARVTMLLYRKEEAGIEEATKEAGYWAYMKIKREALALLLRELFREPRDSNFGGIFG